MTDSRVTRMRKRTRNMLTAVAGVAIVLIGFSFMQSFSSPAKAVSEQMNEVQLVSGLPKPNGGKATPEKYNGQVRKVAYLTFDDGPNIYQEKILNILKEYNVPATFFMVGQKIPYYQKSVERLVKEGHYPGLHSMTHNYNKLYNQGQIVKEMQQVQDIIQNITGVRATLTRCPHGSMPGLTKGLRDEMAAAGLKEWDWTVDSLDWKQANNPNGIVRTVMSQSTRNKEVILLHEKSQTVKALPAIIEGLRDKGYEFEVYEEASHFPVNFWNDNRL